MLKLLTNLCLLLSLGGCASQVVDIPQPPTAQNPTKPAEGNFEPISEDEEVNESPLPNLNPEVASLFKLINNYRVSRKLAPYTMSSQLNAAAQWLAQDMANKNYFSHTDSKNRSMYVRVSQFIKISGTVGENIAAGNADAQRTLNQWKSSAPHNAALLSSSFDRIGLGRAKGTGQLGWYWVADFYGNYAD